MKKRRLSILLSIVMLLSLLPTTALAADTYPTATAVSVDGNKSFSEGHYYFKNGDPAGKFSGKADNYNAYYNPNTGVLTLQNYNGGSIIAGGATTANITIKLVGNNFVTGSVSSDMGGNITITSDSSGELSITNILSGNNARAIGIAAGLAGSYQTGNVTIMGDAKVIISATNNNNVINYAEAYGIFAKENITISGDASAEITCATPRNTTGGGNCNGLYAAKDVTIYTNGTINIDVTNAGKDKDNGYSYGVYPMGTATLTKVGNMEVQWKKAGNDTRYSGGAVYKKGTSLSDKDYAINEDTTNCYASYRYGTPHTVEVVNGTLAGTGVVSHANNNGNFLAGDTVEIKPSEMKGKSGEVIPFQKWTAEGMTLTSPSTKDTSFNVPNNDVTVTATYNPFDGAPTFTPAGSTGTEGTLTFTTVVDPKDGSEGFYLVKEVDVDTTSKYISINPSKTSTDSPHVYSSTVNFNNFPAGNYYVAEYLNGTYYLSEKFTVSYAAAPTVTYPDSVRVYNGSGTITSLSDGQCLVTNDGSATSYTGGAYVARYEKSSGTLYLKDYHGVATDDRILADGDLNIEVVSDSSFSTSVSATNDLYGIQANGKLNISGSGKLTVTATGSGDVYGIYANDGVTISAPLDVTVGKNNTEETGPVYGIYTESGAISLSGADKTITATGGKDPAYGVYKEAQTSSAGSGNITISGTLTVNPSNGTSNYGIYTGSVSTITLDAAVLSTPSGFDYGIFNNNGNVVIKNHSDVTLNSGKSGSYGIWAFSGGDLIIENSTVKVSADSLAACLERGNVSIKDSKVELTSKYKHYEVIRTGNSSLENTINLSGEGSVTLTASGEQTSAMITGGVTLVGSTKCVKGTEYNYGSYKNYDGEYDSASNKTVLQFVHESTAPTATVADVTIAGEKGSTITEKNVVITLTNDNFYSIAADTVVSSWFTNLPTGLDAKIKTAVKDNDTTATIEISGTPSETSSAPLVIKIPAANLVTSTSDLDVTSNENAVFAITTPITDTLVPVSNLTGKTYNESAQVPTFGGSLTPGTDYTVSYALKSSSTGSLDSDGKPVGAGIYVVTVAGKGSYTGSFTKDFKIDKATPVYIAPTAKTGLAYTGSVLELITAGSVSKGGEMQYKLDGDTYSTTIPTATNAGNYTVYYQITESDNYNAVAETQVGIGAINITPAEWGTPTEILTPVNPTTPGGSDGQITGTTSAMQYKKSDGTWTDCISDVTGLAAGNYYVRYKADGNHTASDTNYKTVTLTDPGATLYGVTVTDGTAAPTGDQAAGTEVTITANTKTGFNFKEWTGLADSDYKSGSTKTSNPATFIMPASNVSVKATFTPAALIGTASITGNLKYDEELTASLAGGNNTGTLTYTWYRSGETTAIATNNTGKYTLTADDIGKTITVKISSDVQTGEITSSATGNIAKADGPAAPVGLTGVAPTTSGGADGKIKNTDTTLEYSKTTDFATKYDCSASETTGLTAGTYYVRAKETSTHNAGAYATVNVPAYTGGGGSGGGGGGGGAAPATPQKPEIKPVTGGKVSLSADGTTATITPDAGKVVDKVLVNGKDMGAVTELKGLKTGDKIEVLFKDEVKEPSKAETDKQVKANMQKLAPKARSLKTKAGNVKVSFEGQFKDIEALGYTVKYKFYRSTKKASGYKHMLTTSKPSYTNTGGKKGTLYYYKAIALAYDKDGKLIAKTELKQCKYASRRWTK